MIMSDEWKPTEEDLEWTLDILDNLAIDATWTTGEMLFRRSGEKELTLVSRTNRAFGALQRVMLVLNELNWSLTEDGAKILSDDPVEQLAEAQQEALSWTCPADCNQPVVNMPLSPSKVRWVNQGMQPLVDAMGQLTGENAEMWTVEIRCDKCNHAFMLKPMHYGLLVGDSDFYTLTYDEVTIRVLGRDEVIKTVDESTTDNLLIVGSKHPLIENFKIPPHMQGTLCLHVTNDEEE